MFQRLRHYSIFYLLLTCTFSACKKDLLHYQSVQQLDSHTTTDRFNKILFVNDSVGFIVGGQRFLNATILITRDGGNTWQNYSFPEAGKELFGIAQAPSGIVYCTGFDGKLLYSSDTGNNWTFRQLQYYPYLDIAFTDATHGIIIGGVSFDEGFMAHVDDKGNTSTQDSLGYQLNKIKMVDNQTGYIAAYGTVLKTTDAGQTWNPLNIKNDDFTGIYIPNNNEIWVCGYNGSIYHSPDAGQSWQRKRNGNDITIPRYRLLDIIFKDAATGWAVGESGIVIHTEDGGGHWEQYDHFTSNSLRSIVILSNGDLLVAGDNGSLYRLKTM